MNWGKTLDFIIKNKTQFWLYVIIAIVASIQLYLLGTKHFNDVAIEYTEYNNYIIFKQSFFHLLHHENIYQLYPIEYWDLFKYSPTFSLFFGLFAYLPDVIGLSLWNLLNALVFLFSIWYLPKLDNKQKGFITFFVFIEMLTSLQSTQSNGLMAGLIIFAFGFLERKHVAWASLMIVLSIFIKLFGIVAFALFLFYPNKIKAIGWTLLWSTLVFILPAFFIGWEPLLEQYQWWKELLVMDHEGSLGFSVMGWFDTWLGIKPNKLLIPLIGVVLFLLPLAQIKKYNLYQLRLLNLASILIWVVIFNHKAESPTFIIAIAGVALWYWNAPKNQLNTVLLILAFIFTTLSVTDFFPSSIRHAYIFPYGVKAVACILIWAKIVLWDMWQVKNQIDRL